MKLVDVLDKEDREFLRALVIEAGGRALDRIKRLRAVWEIRIEAGAVRSTVRVEDQRGNEQQQSH